MAPKTCERAESMAKKEPAVKESLLIRQRLRNLIELAVIDTESQSSRWLLDKQNWRSKRRRAMLNKSPVQVLSQVLLESL